MARSKKSDTLDRNVRKMVSSALPSGLADIYMRTLRHWMRNKGPEWTAKRLKALWNCALLLRSGDSASVPKVCSEERIACSNGLPKGIEGVLVKNFSHVQRPSRIRAASVPLRAYTAITLTKASPAQIAKAKKSITTKGSDAQWRATTAREYRNLDATVSSGQHRFMALSPFGKRVKPKDGLKLDNLNRLSGTSRYPSANLAGRYDLCPRSKHLKEYPYLSMLSSMLTKGKVPSNLVDYFGDFQLRKYAEQVQESYDDPTYGRINVIQEGGAKGRVICSPNAWLQFYCMPFHRYLAGLVMSLERGSLGTEGRTYGTSAMFDQIRGVYLALNRLTDGSFCAGVDLSSATDRFPLNLQQAMCEEFGIPQFAEALSEVRGPYWGPDGELWSYGAGQPMGLYGSFPLFHLTHYSLLNGLSCLLGLQADGTNFAVLGDDVLIFEESLLERYLTWLETYQVPVSWNKCYQGNLVEFAGFVLTKAQGAWTAFRPYKYGKHGEMSSILNVLHALGYKTRGWSKYWAKAFEIYQKTAGLRQLDLSPLVPEDSHIRKDESLPSGHWFGSLLNRLPYETVALDGKTCLGDLLPNLEQVSSAWHADRYTLCQTQISDTNPYYHGAAQPDDRLLEPTTFSPESYVTQDFLKKKAWKTFYHDPIIGTYMQ